MTVSIVFRDGEYDDNTHWIPTYVRLESFRPTSRIIPRRDVGERIAQGSVQQRVQEPKRLLPSVEQSVVQQRDDAGERRGGGTGSEGGQFVVSKLDGEVDTVRGHIRVRSTRGGVPALVCITK